MIEKLDIPTLLFRKFVSMRTSVYLLAALLPFYVLGTVFPQGGDPDLYEQAGGAAAGLVRFLGLLDIFHTPWFLIPAALLFINLVVCVYDRFRRLRSGKRLLPGRFEADYTIALDDGVDIKAVTERMTENLSFRVVAEKVGGDDVGKERTGWTVLERGVSYRWLTWIYHLAMAACLVGFLITGLFMLEGELTLKPHAATKVTDPEEVVGWLIDKDHPGPGFHLVLDNFITEYNEKPTLDYPVDKWERASFLFDWRELKYTLKEDSFSPKDWFSELRVVDGRGTTVIKKRIEVNHPLRYGGYTFYQLGYEQALEFHVEGSPEIVRTESGATVQLPGIEGSFRIGTFRTGTLYTVDGKVEEIRPFVKLTPLIEGDEGGGGKKSAALEKLFLGASIEIDGRKVAFTSAREDSILSYRRDPAIPLLWTAGTVVFVVMLLRVFGSWYMAAVKIEDGRLLVSVETKGLVADGAALIDKLKKTLAGPER